MRKFGNIFLGVLLCIVSSLSFFACNKKNTKDFDFNNVHNLIVLIGDGMGVNHIENTKIYYKLGEQSFEDYYVSSVNTNSLTTGPTDSAAAATALATGISVKNGQISHNGADQIKSIMEMLWKTKFTTL